MDITKEFQKFINTPPEKIESYKRYKSIDPEFLEMVAEAFKDSESKPALRVILGVDNDTAPTTKVIDAMMSFADTKILKSKNSRKYMIKLEYLDDSKKIQYIPMRYLSMFGIEEPVRFTYTAMDEIIKNVLDVKSGDFEASLADIHFVLHSSVYPRENVIASLVKRLNSKEL